MGYLTHLKQLLGSVTVSQVTALIIVAFLLLSFLNPESPTIPNAPVHGRRWRWEPSAWLQYRFMLGSHKIIKSGYNKYKDRPFVVKRSDVNFNVLPNRYLDELRLVPETKLSAMAAQIQNIGHKWTQSTVLTESHLHFRAVQTKLGAELPKFLDIVKGELDYAWELHMPKSKDWQEIDILKEVRMLAARTGAKVFLGHPACRNEEWLKLSIGYSTDVFITGYVIRIFPTWLHPIVAQLIPTRYRIAKQLKSAYRILVPLAEKHADAVRRRALGEDVDEEDTLFNWMIDNGTRDENKIEKLVRRQLTLNIAGIHAITTSFTAAIFELCAHPEYIPMLREEIEGVTEELGPINSSPEASVKGWLQRLEKLDSFFIETLRMNPLLLLAPQRVALESLTLKDGTYIPKGSRICWANDNQINDPSITPNPEVFDPLRSYVKRHSSPDQMNKHLAGQTSPDNLSFGYGKLACPGRHFGVNEFKLIMARLIMEYDFKLPDNATSRPRLISIDEFMFTDPKARVMMKLR
ncbi:hypothetical protein GQX73_g6208 [Xylaria multiplex]|uniref:Cytochrome P450 n=1 Tax=Xylaria multiplex TaxID=323545 RepID=A0A7C8MR00_9PEZI|nr:hypothetical protein GQX73_g6208 [Xylaria multiplex]